MVKRLLKILFLVILSLLLTAYAVKRPSWVSRAPFPTSTDPLQLKAHVSFLSQITDRSHANAAGLQQASNYIQEQLLQMGWQPEQQTFKAGGVEYHNVIVRLHGHDEELVVVGAHYDSFGALPGADDNASGVAGLLELARLLQDKAPDQAIELVFYTLEEPPHYAGQHMGSYVHAHSLKQPVKLMISLEMIGYFSDQPNSQAYPSGVMKWLYPDTGHFIAVVDQLFSMQAQRLKKSINEHTSMEAYSINAPAWIPGIDFSDHRNYWAIDVPAVMVTDTAFYRNQGYHTAQDTVDTLNYEQMSEVVWGVYQHLLTY